MYKIVLVFHIIVAVTLIGMILIQRGRSGGLVEALGGVESIFGTKTSSLLVKFTVVLTVIFFSTSISLAYLYKVKAQKEGKSLIEAEEQAGQKQQ
ncbi:MAG: preprotein translocase subunit SecG [Candidatus Omnitrophica bacterium]|nr:preprotein translocase subunit SecG [Candidatus Omnitrophota bacterium]MCF7876945.1 preprotein translocase subunit SecG [Candidatus Omnitrophota bacterium]MCF7878708.1 preprotein translocase subunit SecG [Candidatus Omnitrophota bacterium]MCF7893122.1 preprotein translocase subunit SecG [Candidatus Omnitrophota bacterium]